jgi:hypothetical protein
VETVNEMVQAVETNVTGFKWPNFIVINNPPVTLEAAHCMNRQAVEDCPSAADYTIKTCLAEQLVKKILDEDLIDITINDDPSNINIIYKAKLKILQE